MIRKSISFALSCVGLGFRSDYLRLLSRTLDDQESLDRLANSNTVLTKANADLRYAIELHKRESSAHAASARDATHRLSVAETDKRVAENKLLVAERLDVGASCVLVGAANPENLNGGKYILQVGIKNNDAHTVVELRSLARNRKNRDTLKEIAGKINAACERRPLAQRLEEAGLAEKREPVSLLRPATPAPVFSPHNGNGKPKGFA